MSTTHILGGVSRLQWRRAYYEVRHRMKVLREPPELRHMTPRITLAMTKRLIMWVGYVGLDAVILGHAHRLRVKRQTRSH